MPTLQSPPIADVVRAQSDADHEYVQMQRFRREQCRHLDKMFGRALEMLGRWEAVIAQLDADNCEGRIDNYRAIGDALYPYAQNLNVIVEDLLEEVDSACFFRNRDEFVQLATWWTETAMPYMENWPRTKQEQYEEIRAQLDGGMHRPVMETMDEVRSAIYS